MDAALGFANNYGLAGLVIFALFYCINRMHNSDQSKDGKVFELCIKLLELFSDERSQNNARINELTKAITETTSKLPTFCGERRKIPTDP